VPVEELLEACAGVRFSISRAELEEVVARSDKRRFAFDPTGKRIRANQGHSVEVDLELEPAAPPEALYHGTAERFAGPIEREGLRKMARHHVHLSGDVETARSEGGRRGRAVVFVVAAGAMHRAGHRFYRSANGVWLVDHVPAEYLRRLEVAAVERGGTDGPVG